MEKILTFNASAINRLLKLQGAKLTTCAEEDSLIVRILECDPAYLPRETVEKDFSRKQLLPYVAFNVRGTDKVLVYVRKNGEEVRLDAKRSIGIGGHISLEADARYVAPLSADPEDCYRACAREIREELGLQPHDYNLLPVGWLNDNSEEVGRVHFARLYVAQITQQVADELAKYSGEIVRDEALVGFYSVQDVLRAQTGDNLYENWSRLFTQVLATAFKF